MSDSATSRSSAPGGATPFANRERAGCNPARNAMEGSQMRQMGQRHLDWLTIGIKRLHEALNRFWNRQAPPPGASQRETYTDQW